MKKAKRNTDGTTLLTQRSTLINRMKNKWTTKYKVLMTALKRLKTGRDTEREPKL